ncbi:hypothetical protein DY000_02012574 [Brassica cretica]|uniref:Uncharacterized protein n=1 Tax=Brassica cretica TaxID=69181 RepID=A0ABQ7D745_BRACR|nr:hypothetical protein DY000_02012574 [Brassica cretica]
MLSMEFVIRKDEDITRKQWTVDKSLLVVIKAACSFWLVEVDVAHSMDIRRVQLGLSQRGFTHPRRRVERTQHELQRGSNDAGSITRAHEEAASSTIQCGLDHAGWPTRTHENGAARRLDAD